jgi:exodeoxyribonuclease V alpha subunit
VIDISIHENRLIDEDGCIFLAATHAVETELAEQIIRICRAEVPRLDFVDAQLEEDMEIRLASEQRRAVALAAQASMMVLTGGPGTGKTTTVRAILGLFSRTDERVLLAAPTGRAARRLADATGKPASTLHRLLGFNPMEGFRHDADEPLVASVIVIDEASMLDQALAVALLRAVSSGTRVIFVGDADQLPSVGAGNVLGDLLEANVVPAVRLEEIFRQAQQSEIVLNAHRILSGIIPKSSSRGVHSDFYIVEVDTPDRAAELIGIMVSERIPRRFGLNPIDDVQVLAPMHRGVCGAQQLNVLLQEHLNADGMEISLGGRAFRVGDKVMQIRNDYQKEVFNGDIGRVVARGDKGLVIRFDERRVEYDRDGLDNIVLAYACSVHKSQGSEYPAVILPVLTEHWVMLQRNLLYTALTRGRQLVVLVGQRRAIARAVKNTDGIVRNTGLARRLEPNR